MALAPITVVIRCSNQSTYAGTPYKEITLYCYANKPRRKDAENSETTPDVGGYQSNSIAYVREYELVIQDCTVAESDEDMDFGMVDLWSRYLYAKKLWIKEVTGSPRVHRSNETTDSPWWTSGNGITLPQECRRVSFDYGDGENGSLSPVLVLEDVMPVIGAAIS
jgi:hypothetical protein